jgi:Restriction endonuclease XhoI
MTADNALADLDGQLRNAVSFFWSTRSAQGERQGEETGDRDRGGRAAVTGGGHCEEFVRIIRNLIVGSGIPDAHVFTNRRVTDLPGYFRATKDWDLVAVVDGTLLAVVELKSQVGSFGNNFNNRTEEAIGNATDLWTAYREGAFKSSPRPWLGYFMMLEDAAGSTRPVSVREQHFKVFKEFRGTSYADRYTILCERLVLERLYDSACLIMSSRATGPSGDFREPSARLSFRLFATSLVGHATAYAKLRG